MSIEIKNLNKVIQDLCYQGWQCWEGQDVGICIPHDEVGRREVAKRMRI